MTNTIKTSQENDEFAIRELINTWMEATKEGDIETVLSLMTDDVIFMTPGNKPFGKEMFSKASKDTKGKVRFEGTSNVEEIKLLGEWAYVRSYLRVVTIPPDGGTPVHRSGYTLTILHKETDGKWRLSRDANMLSLEI